MKEETFTIEIAGTPVHVTAPEAGLAGFCREFLTDREPVCSVAVTEADIAEEKALASGGAYVSGRRDLVSTALFRRLTEELADRDALLIHGSAFAFRGEGVIVCAPSGTGKSTHVRFWRELFPDEVCMINDDKPFIRFGEEGPILCSSPWRGKHRLGTKAEAPLRHICFLTRSLTGSAVPLPASSVLPRLLSSVYRPESSGRLLRVLGLTDRLQRSCRFWELFCPYSPSAARTARQALFPED
ncbi:MAG: hypothetical protein ILP12_00535 [Lachnospiraceae bacterium]|nr:hypothetical protein [Lachnospiraceae bacterium]